MPCSSPTVALCCGKIFPDINPECSYDSPMMEDGAAVQMRSVELLLTVWTRSEGTPYRGVKTMPLNVVNIRPRLHDEHLSNFILKEAITATFRMDWQSRQILENNRERF